MKKLFFSLAVLSVALVSCGGNKAAAVDSDSVADTVAVEEVVVDSTDSGVVADTVVAVAE